ncbi:MAG: hypothetical protein SFY66_19770 [Oculatellaceae cyanobacterium bins.114]|nr:hypothetical protein [Oculatellaceae cyanobacterium bins.114]
MADLLSFINEFTKYGYPRQVANDPRIQFGTQDRAYLGAQIMPMQTSDTNMIIEDLGRFEVVVAGDGDSLSPPQIKQSAGGAELMVRLGHIDIASQMTARDMKRLGNLLDQGDRAAAEEFLTRWLTRAIRLGIEEKAEVQRWQMLCNAQVTVQYLDQPSRTLNFPDLQPSGHRVTVPSGTTGSPTGWYSDTFDPMKETIIPLKIMLEEKGYMVSRIVTSTTIRDGVLASNAKMMQRSGGTMVINTGGQLETIDRNLSDVNSRFIANELPRPEVYNLRYKTQSNTARFLGEDKFVMLCTTGRSLEIDLGDEGIQVIEDVFGYYGVGVSDGQTEPGAVITTRYSDLKPVGIYAEGYEEGFPVLLEPEALVVITIPKPTA